MVAAAKSKKLLATDIEIMSAIADIRAALKYGPRLPNTWGFFSNKNRQLLTLLGDVTFIQAVLLEGDPQVRDYVIAQPLGAEVKGYHFGRDLVIKFRDGSMRWYFCGRYENLVSAPSEDIKNRIQHTRQLAAEMGAEFYTRTERDFANRMTEFRNWLKLCSAMTRSRDFSVEHETAQIFLTLDTRDSVAVRTLMDMPDCDPALMLAAIARLIANGYAESDLAERTLHFEGKSRRHRQIFFALLQSEVLSFLKKHHVRDDEYPFNTKDRCYSSLSSLGRSILFKRPIRFIHSRSGKAAAALAHTGTGILSLLQATEPFQVAELDFHKHDSAAIVVVRVSRKRANQAFRASISVCAAI